MSARKMVFLSIISVLLQSVSVRATSDAPGDKEEKSPEQDPTQAQRSEAAGVTSEKPTQAGSQEGTGEHEIIPGYKDPITALAGMLLDKDGKDAGTFAKNGEDKKDPEHVVVHATGDRMAEQMPVWIKTRVAFPDGQTTYKYRVGVCENMKLGNDDNIVKFNDGEEQQVAWDDFEFELPKNAQTVADFNKDMDFAMETGKPITDDVDGNRHYYKGQYVLIQGAHTQGGYTAKVLTGPDAGNITRVSKEHFATYEAEIRAKKIAKIATPLGIVSMGLGAASGVTAIILGALLGTDNLHMGSFSIGIDGLYLFVIILAIAAFSTLVSGACFFRKNGWGTGLLITAGVFTLGSAGFGIAAGCGGELGKVAVKDVSVATVMIIGFSALAVTAFIWGACCYKNKVVCSKKAWC